MKPTIRPTQRAAMKIALKTGLLRQCTRHWVYLRSKNTNALEHAFRLGNYLISHFARSVACFKGNRQLMTDTILKCSDQAPTHCPHCAGEQSPRSYALFN